MGMVMSVGTGAASALASCCVGSAASCVCSGLKAIMPSGYTAAKVYALILFCGALWVRGWGVWRVVGGRGCRDAGPAPVVCVYIS